jgi:hypothetical protein
MTNPTRKAVFFIRAYNDMDHLTPVVWKLATTTDIPVSVVIRMGKDTLNDYRMNYLRQFPRVEVRHISEFGLDNSGDQEGVPQKARPGLLQRVQRKVGGWFAPPPAKPAPKAKHEVDPAKVDAMLDALFGSAEQGIVVFDWVTLSSFHRTFALTVANLARKRGYANLSLPHGDSPYWNEMFKMEDINYSAMEHYQDNPLDVVVVPNPLTAKRYTPFRNEQQLKVIGSARYNDEWMQVMKTLLPDFHIPGTEKMLKLVMFLRNSEFPINWEQVIYSIQLATQFPDVYLVVKHHTRGGAQQSAMQREHLELSKLNRMTAPNLKIVYNDTHSGSLLQWADAVLELGTSISFEAIKLNKPLLALEYLHANISTTAHYLPRTAMRCKDDLYDAIEALRKDRETRLYTEAERHHFMREVIDYPDERVLERYTDLVVSLMDVRLKAGVE